MNREWTIDFDSLAAEYARHRRVHPGVLKDLLDTGRVSPASRVLDVGCGTGSYVAAIESAIGCECWGIDPSEGMLSRARGRSAAARFRRGRAEELSFPSAAFDLVYSVDVIHHVVEHDWYFREAHRVLRPGGRFCTVTDSEDIIRRREPLSIYFPETVEVDSRRYPPISELRRGMAEAGFVCLSEHVVEFSYRLTDVHPYRDRAYSALHLISDEAYARGLWRLERDLRKGPVNCVSRYMLLWATRPLEKPSASLHHPVAVGEEDGEQGEQERGGE